MIGTVFHKVPGSDEVLCSRCAIAKTGAAELGVPLYPHHFPGVYRLLACRDCGASCSCRSERCGTAGCHRLRSSRPGEDGKRQHGITEPPTGTASGFNLAGQGRFRF